MQAVRASSGRIDYGYLVAGDVSPDGTRILLRKWHNEGAFMWFRDVEAGETVEEAITR